MGSASNAASDRRVFVLQDPEPFYKAQERNRRATWRMAFMCAVAAFLMGIPLNLVLTPVFYAVTLALAEIVNLLFPLRPWFWRQSTGELGSGDGNCRRTALAQGEADYFLLVLIVMMIVLNAAFMAVWMMIIYTVFSALTHR